MTTRPYIRSEDLTEDIKFVSKEMGCKKELLVTLNQKHSSEVVCFNSNNEVKNKLAGDAIVSKVKNIFLDKKYYEYVLVHDS